MIKLLYALIVVLGISGFLVYQGPKVKQHGIDPKALDKTTSPRSDFYQFVNGPWLKNTSIPADRGSWGSLDEINAKTNDDILSALHKALQAGTYPAGSDQHKALTFYQMAMDTAYLNRQGYEPLKPMLHKARSVQDEKSLQAYLQEAIPNGMGSLFNFMVFPDLMNSKINVLYLTSGSLGLPNKEYYTRTDQESVAIQEKYQNHIKKMFQLLGYSAREAAIKAGNVLRMETRLAAPMLSEVEKRNPTLLYNKRRLAALNETTPAIHWNSFLKALGMEAPEAVIVLEPAYMETLGKVLAEKDWASLADCLEWHSIHYAADYLGNELVEAKQQFWGKTLWGAQEMKPRPQAVLEVCNKQLGEAVGRVYVDTYFPQAAKEKALEMAENIVLAFGQRIKSIDWMSEPTKAEALKKLKTLRIKVGYPDQWKDYQELVVKGRQEGGTYLGNVVAASAWKFREEASKIGKAVDQSEWYMAPQTVNASYNPMLNEIAFTAAMLQPPFYDFRADDAVNYGAIGCVIGHEISHAFDDIGSRHDAEGNLKDWWALEDRKAYEDKKQLLIEQFNHYQPLPGMHVNGALTIGENISDLGGVNVAFEGLMRQLTHNGKPGKLDGFTPEQRFFISYVTLWRTKYREEHLKTMLNTDPHSPGRYRALGPLENMAAFHKAFGIKPGDPMYKDEKARVMIW